MRVSVVRGNAIRPSDIPNYDFGDDVDVEFVVSRSVAPSLRPLTSRPVRALRDVGDVVGRLPGPIPAASLLVAGNAEWLMGLEDAVRGADIVQTAELDYPLSAQAVAARDRGACRAVVCLVMENIAFWPAQNPIVARRVRRVAKGVDHFIAVTERARLHLETSGVSPERISVIPMGIDIDRFVPRERSGEPEGGPVRVLCVSRLEKGKGVEDLAVAAGLLEQRGISVSLTFVGSGPSRAAIDEIAAHYGIGDRVSFPGFLPWDRLHEVYAEHDVFALPSAPTRNWREQFGFAVIEAMACGLPVVVGNSGSLMEVVGREDALVAPHDPLGLVDRLERLTTDAALRREHAAFNRAFALEHYDVRKVREQVLAVYERALARASS